MVGFRIAVRGVVAALVIGWGGAAAAQPAFDDLETIPLTQAEQTIADGVLARGRLMHALDQAAWYATDEALEQATTDEMAQVRGWIVEPQGDRQIVLFYGLDGETPYGVLRVEMRLREAIAFSAVPEAQRAMTPVQVRMVQARLAAAEAVRARCESVVNVMVIPPADAQAPVDVYLLTPQLRTGEYPFGGHERLAIGPDGEVLSRRSFTDGCITLPKEGDVGPMMISHLLDPMPTEIHTFLATWMEAPVIVVTSGPSTVWRVEPNEVAKLDLDSSAGAQ